MIVELVVRFSFNSIFLTGGRSIYICFGRIILWVNMIFINIFFVNSLTLVKSFEDESTVCNKY